MEPREYNRDVKRLLKKFLEYKEEPDVDTYYRLAEKEIKPELKRLYYADNEFIYAKAESIRILMRINLVLRVIPLHQFGIFINEYKIYTK